MVKRKNTMWRKPTSRTGSRYQCSRCPFYTDDWYEFQYHGSCKPAGKENEKDKEASSDVKKRG